MKPLGAREAARVESVLKSGLALWTMLRTTWGALALAARDRGNRRAAARAQQELIRCELECVSYQQQLAMLRKRGFAASRERSR